MDKHDDLFVGVDELSFHRTHSQLRKVWINLALKLINLCVIVAFCIWACFYIECI